MATIKELQLFEDFCKSELAATEFAKHSGLTSSVFNGMISRARMTIHDEIEDYDYTRDKNRNLLYIKKYKAKLAITELSQTSLMDRAEKYANEEMMKGEKWQISYHGYLMGFSDALRYVERNIKNKE